jgi:hypothetical protein
MAENVYRDEFTKPTKKILAERVAYRCSFTGCGKITIGPNKSDNKKSLSLGEAAHICAASPKGPRYDCTMRHDERKSILNGIWMCCSHATFIDRDYTTYSIETLRLWKQAAENQAYENLALQENWKAPETTTLISLGFGLIFYGRWLKVNGFEWDFEIVSFLKGDINILREYSSTFASLDNIERFIIVESQGDARTLTKPVIVKSNNTQLKIQVLVDEKFTPTDPNKLGLDLALGANGDICISNNRFATTSGINAAIQRLSVILGTIKGEWFLNKNVGSLTSSYYNEYKGNLDLLSRLLKLELIRLSLLDTSGLGGHSNKKPPLHFINRIEQVIIPKTELTNSRLPLEISLVWGNGQRWSGSVPVFIKEIQQ